MIKWYIIKKKLNFTGKTIQISSLCFFSMYFVHKGLAINERVIMKNCVYILIAMVVFIHQSATPMDPDPPSPSSSSLGSVSWMRNANPQPLHRAALAADIDEFEECVESDANINIQDDNGALPVDYAARGNNVDVLRWLIEHGANVHSMMHKNHQEENEPSEEGAPPLVKYLSCIPKPDVSDDWLNNPFQVPKKYAAALQQHQGLILYALDKDVIKKCRAWLMWGTMLIDSKMILSSEDVASLPSHVSCLDITPSDCSFYSRNLEEARLCFQLAYEQLEKLLTENMTLPEEGSSEAAPSCSTFPRILKTIKKLEKRNELKKRKTRKIRTKEHAQKARNFRNICSILTLLQDGQTKKITEKRPFLPFQREGKLKKIKAIKKIKTARSKTKPIIATFECEDDSVVEVLIKEGDDLRYDQLILIVLRALNYIWEKENVRNSQTLTRSIDDVVHNLIYKVDPVNSRMGYIRLLPDAVPVEEIRGTLPWRLDLIFGIQQADNQWPVSSELYNSAVATFVAGYIFQLGDRHQGNMMLSGEQLANIDFGYIAGEKPFPDTSDFPIPRGLRNNLEDGDGERWKDFKELCWQALEAARKNWEVLATVWVKSAYEIGIESNRIFLYPARVMKKLLDISKEDFFSTIEWGTLRKLLKDRVHEFNQKHRD